MQAYNLKKDLVYKLPAITGLSVQLFLQRTGIDKSKWSRIKKDDTIYLNDLFAMSNGLHIPISHFIGTKEGGYSIEPKRDEYVVRPAQYRECYWRAETVDELFGSDLPYKVRWQELAPILGVTDETVAAHLRPKSGRFTAMPVQELLDLCNKLELNLGLFIASPNLPIPDIYPELDYGDIRSHLTLASERDRDAEVLSDRVRTLEREMRELQAKFDRLSAQLRRAVLTKGVGHVSGGIGIGAYYDYGDVEEGKGLMAAEASPEEQPQGM